MDEEDEEFERIERESGWRKRQINRGTTMDEARQAFENYMKSKGRDISALWDGFRYTNTNMNTKWTYFFLGWMIKENK
jgi:hypothetical protein